MKKGFFASLFDISFRSLITPRIIKVLYVLALILIGIMTAVGLIFAVVALSQDPASGIITLIAVPLLALIYLIYIRVALEVVIALFHVMQNTSEMVRIGGGRPATSGVFVSPALAEGQVAAVGSGGGAPGGQPTEAGWFPDPQGQARLRYFDGSSWTAHTSD
jgi:hypothetical protein